MGQGFGQDWDDDTGHSARAPDSAQATPGFEGYDLHDVPLGDLLRGERATLGKSLLDVERELRIRAAYIAAIENGDIGAFASQGFIAGYVRSYARYLQIDPEWTFRRFCDETGFKGAGGQSKAAEAKRSPLTSPLRMDPNEVMASSRFSFSPERDSFLSRVEPGALGSVAVLAVLAIGIGYGAWAILHDIQRLQIAPIDEAPVVPLAQLDPLAGAADGAFDADQGFDIAVPGPESNGGLYRPQALEAPVLTPRDGALATLDPNEVGTLASPDSVPRTPPQLGGGGTTIPTVQVTQPVDQVMIFATSPTWIRVTSPAGDTIYEATLNRGDSYVVPDGETAPLLRSGNAGSLYFAVNGEALGPAGPGATIVRDVELRADVLAAAFEEVPENADPEVIEIASTVLEAYAIPTGPVVVPEAQADLVVYNPTGGAQVMSYFPSVTPDMARALIASNALPVVIVAPGPDDLRPQQRP